MTKQAKIHNGEKTASSINGVGKTGQLHAKELNYFLTLYTEIKTNGTRQKTQKQTHVLLGTLFLTKEARIYNGAKTASSINDDGKTGQLHVKE